MTAIEIVIKRTGISEENADYYVTLAEMRVRNFLKLEPLSDVSQYMFAISDIATLMLQMDKSTKNAEASLGFQSKKLSEGGVSKSESGMTGSYIRSQYEDEIQDILNSLLDGSGQVRFL